MFINILHSQNILFYNQEDILVLTGGVLSCASHSQTYNLNLSNGIASKVNKILILEKPNNEIKLFFRLGKNYNIISSLQLG